MSLVLVPAAWLTGWLLFGALEGRQSVRDHPFAAWLGGLAVLALLLLGVGSFSLQAAVAVVVLLGAGGAYICTRPDGRPGMADFEPIPEEPLLPRFVVYALYGAIGISLGLAFLGSLAPVTGWDATVAHLALPADYAREGRIFLQDGNVYSAYPQLVHTLFAVAYTGGGEQSVTLLNWLFGVAACYAVYGLARQMAGRHAGLAAAAILASAPIFADQAGSPAIDLAFTAFATTALWMVLRWCWEGEGVSVLFAAVLAGSSCGIRHTGYLVCLLLVVALVFYSPALWGWAAAFFSIAALFLLLPWMLRTWWLVGNPFFPFFTAWFPVGPIDHNNITGVALHETARGSGLLAALGLLRFPWDIVMRPSDYDGWSKSPGALVLILGIPAIFLGRRPARAVASYSAAGIGALYFFQRFARYLLPFFTPMMALAGVAAVRIPRARGLVLAVLLAHVAYGLALHGAAVSFKIPAALGMVSREDYLRARVERLDAFAYANRELNDGSRIFTLDQRSYFLDMPAFQNHWALEALLEMPLEWQHAWFVGHGIKYILYPAGYVAKSGNIKEAAESLLRQWLEDKEHFQLVTRFESHSPRGGTEEILFLRVEPFGGGQAAP